MSTTTLKASEARARFADALDNAQHHDQRTVILRRNRVVGGIVPPADLELLQQLEDRMDLAAAVEALKEPGSVTLDELKAELGL